MLSSQCAYVDSNEERITTRWAIIQRSESFQPRLLDQIFRFFHYFWRFELIWFRARIMSFTVCQVVNAHELIQAREDDDRRKISHSAQWISSISFTRSNLNIFQIFWKHWTRLIQSYNYAFQSMSDSQCAYVDSSEKRWWQTRDRSISALNLVNLDFWVKSQYFLIILKALNLANSELQLCYSKYVR